MRLSKSTVTQRRQHQPLLPLAPCVVCRPPCERFARLSAKERSYWHRTSMTMKYGVGAPLPIWELNGWHFVDFSALYSRLVARGLLPAAPPRSKYCDDPASAVMRLLYWYHDNHQEFEDIVASRDPSTREHYLPLRSDVAMVGDPPVPFVELRLVAQTLAEHPYLSLEEKAALDDEFNKLYAACLPIILAPAQFPTRGPDTDGS